MLAVWPVVVVVLFRRLPPDRALIWTILGAYLILPPVVALDLPVVPDLGKNSIPPLVALFVALFIRRDRISILPDGLLGKLLIGIFILSPFATVMTNAEPVPAGPVMIQGLRLYDSISLVINQAIAVLPYFLARRYLATPDAMRNMLLALMAGGLAYSVPMLIEIRMSPQMNVWVYGFFQHDFLQTMRFGGYRPMVFLPHGLWLAFFAMMAAMAAVVLARHAAPADRGRLVAASLYLIVMLILCKSVGPLVYAALLVPALLLLPRRAQVAVAAGLAVVVICYPLLRGAHLLPVEAVTELAARFSADRAQSFQFRVDNEEALLAHASLKPWFGWGGYGRNLLYDPFDGRVVTITDGAWIIVLGIYGWLGYIVQFGLLVLPLLILAREGVLKRRAALSPWVAAVALLLAANLVDMLPNATIIPFTWLMAGAILGHAEALARGQVQQTGPAPGPQIRRPRTVL